MRRNTGFQGTAVAPVMIQFGPVRLELVLRCDHGYGVLIQQNLENLGYAVIELKFIDYAVGGIFHDKYIFRNGFA